MAKATEHLLISGKVQGVGFRNYTLNQALIGGLQGWVRNLADGRVEALVQGDPETINEFVGQLQKGPSPLARVAGIEREKVELAEDLSSFSIVSDGDETWQKP